MVAGIWLSRLDTWLKDVGLPEATDPPEQRPPRCHVIAEVREPEELGRFFCLRRLFRVSACIWHWRTRQHRSADGEAAPTPLIPEELEAALFRLIRVAQALSFQPELQDIRAAKLLPVRSPLRKLAPMLGDEGILQIGGRLKHSILVIEVAHRRTLHGGIQATLGNPEALLDPAGPSVDSPPHPPLSSMRVMAGDHSAAEDE